MCNTTFDGHTDREGLYSDDGPRCKTKQFLYKRTKLANGLSVQQIIQCRHRRGRTVSCYHATRRENLLLLLAIFFVRLIPRALELRLIT